MKRADGKTNENQIVARVTEAEKKKLLALAKSKGCEGWTGLVRLLAYAKDVTIKT
ncbi:MAG: hypothetical protein GY775_14405 [Candidatus Scalindua sp.]|nr:hypothetical protein [Candidatus Scalindua sp.]